MERRLSSLGFGPRAGTRSGLATALVIALALRVAWALLVEVGPVSDSHAYDTFALTMVEHGVYGWTPAEPSAYWPVGTAAIIAAVYAIFGHSFAAVVALNVAVSLAIVAMVYRLALGYFGGRVASRAALILAVWPSLVMYVTVLASELFFIACILAGLLLWESRRAPLVRWIAGGLFWAAACYIRPLALLLPVALLMGAALRDRTGWRRAGLGAGATMLVMLLAIAPWTYRNYVVFGSPVLISTNFGPTFWMGNNPETTGGYQDLPDWVVGLPEAERDSALKNASLAYVREEPVAFVQRTLIKLALLHERETIAVVWNEIGITSAFGERALAPLKVVATGFWYLALLGGLAGAALLLRREGPLAGLGHPMIVCWAYFAATHAVIVISDRYHIPVVPFVGILAAVALTALVDRRGPSPAQDRAAHG